MDNNDALQSWLAQYDVPVMLLKGLRAAATEALEAYGTDSYNDRLEGVFHITAHLMAAENYDDYDYDSEELFDAVEAVIEHTGNVIQFPQPRK